MLVCATLPRTRTIQAQREALSSIVLPPASVVLRLEPAVLSAEDSILPLIALALHTRLHRRTRACHRSAAGALTSESGTKAAGQLGTPALTPRTCIASGLLEANTGIGSFGENRFAAICL